MNSKLCISYRILNSRIELIFTSSDNVSNNGQKFTKSFILQTQNFGSLNCDFPV